MKKPVRQTILLKRVSTLICALALAALPSLSNAQDAGHDLSQQEQTAEQEAKKPGFEEALKEKYKLTDEQIKALRDQGMNNTQITMTAALAEKSGKTTDEIAKMRLEQKMGWGKIAKELGVAPREIGQSVASMHRKNEDKKEAREQMKAERKADREARRQEKKEERAERKAEKKEERAERKEKKGKA